jgi:hypothetical protein
MDACADPVQQVIVRVPFHSNLACAPEYKPSCIELARQLDSLVVQRALGQLVIRLGMPSSEASDRVNCCTWPRSSPRLRRAQPKIFLYLYASLLLRASQLAISPEPGK